MNKKQLWIKISVMAAIIVALLTVDLVSKYVLDATLGLEIVTVIPYLFNFRLVHNMGAAWGILAGKQIFLIVLSFAFLAFFIFYYVKEKNKSWLLTITYGLLIAGCLGNLYDRIVIGYVRDFIQFAFWQTFPIFNFADVFLCVGVAMFVIYLLIGAIKSQKAKNSKSQAQDGESGEKHD